MRKSLLSVLVIVAWLLVAKATYVHAEQLSIAVPEMSRDINFLTSNHPGAILVRQAVLSSLVLPQTYSSEDATPIGLRLNYRLSGADSVAVSADKLQWVFRLRPGLLFNNGNVVTSQDVAYSLQRCAGAGLVPEIATVEALTREPIAGVREHSVRVVLRRLDEVQQKKFPLVLSQCPILERSSALIFGPELGQGTNLVGAGDFQMSDMDLGREYKLSRARGHQSAAEQILVRGIKDPRHALTALRTGTIDAMFTSDGSVVELASKDQTLLTSDCLSYKLIRRRGLSFTCDPYFEVENFRYLS